MFDWLSDWTPRCAVTTANSLGQLLRATPSSSRPRRCSAVSSSLFCVQRVLLRLRVRNRAHAHDPNSLAPKQPCRQCPGDFLLISNGIWDRNGRIGATNFNFQANSSVQK